MLRFWLLSGLVINAFVVFLIFFFLRLLSIVMRQWRAVPSICRGEIVRTRLLIEERHLWAGRATVLAATGSGRVPTVGVIFPVIVGVGIRRVLPKCTQNLLFLWPLLPPVSSFQGSGGLRRRVRGRRRLAVRMLATLLSSCPWGFGVYRSEGFVNAWETLDVGPIAVLWLEVGLRLFDRQRGPNMVRCAETSGIGTLGKTCLRLASVGGANTTRGQNEFF